MDFSWAHNKRFCILGLARSGLAAARVLKEQGFPVLVWDDKLSHNAEEILIRENIPLQNLLTYDWQKNDILVISPGIPHKLPAPHPIIARAKAAGVPVTVDVELFLRAIPKNTWVIGVTGTNGKSTTVSLLYHLLKTAGASVALGGNFGVPVFALEPADIYVLELSSYQLELMETPKLNIAVLLNLVPDHLERHGGIEGYVEAKRKIFDLMVPAANHLHAGKNPRVQYWSPPALKWITKRSVAILGVDTPLSAALLEDTMTPLSAKKFSGFISLENAPSLKGQHNAENAFAASTAFLETPHIDHSTLQKGLDTFPGLAHRQQQIAISGKVTFVNDSKATNCDSAIKALECHDNIYWIVGGKLKENDFEVEKFLPFLHKIKAVFTIGVGGPVFQEAFQHILPTFSCGTLDVATHKAYDMAKNTSDQAVVLLSPATASFDQFRDFEDRGESFGRIVHKILKEAP